MKTELATIVIALAGANAFVIPSTTQKALSTKLNGKATYEWAYDAFGTVGPENNYYQGSGDQNNDQIGSGWAHDPWGGVSQTDFFPMAAPVEAEAEPMPEPTVTVPEQAMAQQA